MTVDRLATVVALTVAGVITARARCSVAALALWTTMWLTVRSGS